MDMRKIFGYMESIGRKLLTWLKVNFTPQKPIRNSRAALEWLLTCSYSYESKETCKSLPGSSGEVKDPFSFSNLISLIFGEASDEFWHCLQLLPFRLKALNTSLMLHLLFQILPFPR